MFIDEQFRLIEFLVGFKNAVLNHFKRTAGTFTGSEILQNKFFFPFPVVIKSRIILIRRHDGVGNQLVFQLDLADPIENAGKPSSA